ncbi:MAG: serine hydrolase, partial [Flavobacteriales bacterium]|nr:serine hydrolase [Flavobacteriales bacterium]
MLRPYTLLGTLAIGSLSAQNLYFPPTFGNTWETVDPASLGWCTDQLPPLLQLLEDNGTKAFIVLKDGRIAIEQYFGTFTQDSSWYWASAG